MARAGAAGGELGCVGDVGVGVQQDQPAVAGKAREVGAAADAPRDAHAPGLVEERGDGRVVLAPDDVEHVGGAVALDERRADGGEAEPAGVGDDDRWVDQELLQWSAAGAEGDGEVGAAGLAVAAAAACAARDERRREVRHVDSFRE